MSVVFLWIFVFLLVGLAGTAAAIYLAVTMRRRR
jgi:hypothetical protein